MPAITRKLVVAEVGVIFTHGEEIVSALGLYPLANEAIQQAFRFREMLLGDTAGIPTWVGNEGTIRIGKREYRIDALRGHSRMLVVGVLAETEEARDVLQACFERLRQIERTEFGSQEDPSGEAAGLPVGSRGAPFTSTTAIVRLPFKFEDLVPNAAFLVDHVTDRLKVEGKRIGKPPEYHLNWQIQVDIGPKNLNQAMAIEPRAGDAQDAQLFFTRSPLSTTDHFDMLEKLCARVKPVEAKS